MQAAPVSLVKVLLVASLMASCQWAQAQAFDAVRLYGVPEGDSAGIVGAAVIASPKYMGSNERRITVLPTIDYQWKNGWFAGLSNGIGYQFESRPDIQYGLRVTAELGRKENRSNALAGMGSVQPRPEAGVFFNYLPTPELFVTSTLRYGAGNDRSGMQIGLGAGYTTQLSPQWRTALGVSATYANRNYMQAYFGVTAQQAATSGYAAYSAGAGVRDVRVNASATFFIDRKWSVTGGLTVGSLQGDARRSPITFETTPVSGVLALSYRF